MSRILRNITFRSNLSSSDPDYNLREKLSLTFLRHLQCAIIQPTYLRQPVWDKVEKWRLAMNAESFSDMLSKCYELQGSFVNLHTAIVTHIRAIFITNYSIVRHFLWTARLCVCVSSLGCWLLSSCATLTGSWL